MAFVSGLVALGLLLCLVNAAQPRGKYGKDYVYFYDDENNPHLVNLTLSALDKKDMEETPLKVKPSDIQFRLYTRDSTSAFEELFIDDSTRNDTTYLRDKPLVLLIHGWISNGDSDAVQLIKDALLSKHDLNVIIVNWGKIASNIYYPTAAKATPAVGNLVGKMVQALARRQSVKGPQVHLIGHSLGAHVAGFASRSLQKKKFTAGRVTGLDPARPLFENTPIFEGIGPKDAAFVDIIHTDAGVLGITKTAGQADFFPNGGYHQPECDSVIVALTDACQHSLSYIFYTKSITGRNNKFLSCDSYDNYEHGKCSKNDVQYMGHYCSRKAKGLYFGHAS